MFKRKDHTEQKGALMLEAIAVLGLMTMISPLLYKQISDRNNEVDDVSKAAQMRTIRDGVNAFIQSNEVGIKVKLGIMDEQTKDVPAGAESITNKDPKKLMFSELASDDKLKNALLATMPPGLTADDFGSGSDKLYDIAFLGYTVPAGVKKDAETGMETVYYRPVVSGMVISNESMDTQRRAARIASLIGADGGIVATKAGDNESSQAYGTLGSWNLPLPSSSVSDNTVIALAAYDTTGKNALSRLTSDLDASGYNIDDIDTATAKTVIADDFISSQEEGEGVKISENTIILDGNTFATTVPDDEAEGMTIYVDNIMPYSDGKPLNVYQATRFRDDLAAQSLTSEKDLLVKGYAEIRESALIRGNLHTGGDLSAAGNFTVMPETGLENANCIEYVNAGSGLNVEIQEEPKVSNVQEAELKTENMPDGTETGGIISKNCIPLFQVTDTKILASKPVEILDDLKVRKNTYTNNLYTENRISIGGLDYNTENEGQLDEDGFPTMAGENGGTPTFDSVGGNTELFPEGYPQENAKLIITEGDIYLRDGRLVTGTPVENQLNISDSNETTLDLEKDTLGVETSYYQVDPAYVSIMNDIRLTSRGGARLSQILPNYISKGMYYLTNTYYQGDWPCTSDTCPDYPFAIKGSSDGKFFTPGSYSSYTEKSDGTLDLAGCDTVSCISHPYMGRVPAPGMEGAEAEGKCPVGYAPLITLLPTAFEMSKISHLMIPMSHTHELQIDLTTDDQGNVIGATGQTTNPRTSSGESVLLYYDSTAGQQKLLPYDPEDATDETNQVPYSLIDANRPFKNNYTNTGEYVPIRETGDTDTGYLLNSNMIGQTDNWLVTLLNPVESGNVTVAWDVAMGLINRISRSGVTSYQWNPQGVAPQTMTLFAQTYCVFDPAAFKYPESMNFESGSGTNQNPFPMPKVRDAKQGTD